MNHEAMLNEKNPLIREIWAMGYTHIIQNPCSDSIQLVNQDAEYAKTLPIDEVRCVVASLTYLDAILIDGREHRWIKEGDGSAQRFRELIKPLFITQLQRL